MRIAARFVTMSAALLFSLPAIGQGQQTAPSSSEIVVTGTRQRDEQVRDFVGALTPAPGGSIPRFIDSACFHVSGLIPAHNEAIVARLRQVAAGAKIPVGSPGCAPNMFVIVTRDKRAFIEMLSARRPMSFGAMTAREIRRLARSPGPASAWQLEGPVSTSGVPLRWDDVFQQYTNSTTETPSRIKILAGRGFDAAALVVEAGALDGLTPTQLADYAGMRLLAKADPARLPANAPSTILTALTTPMGSPTPITMTKWDLGLLRGIYASARDLNPGSQRSQVAGSLLRELDLGDAQKN